MTTTVAPGLAVSAFVELLVARDFRVTVALDEAIVAERPVLGVRHALRRVVGQRNDDGTFRIGYLFARAGQPGGPVYENELVAREPRCRDIAQLTHWLTIQDARVFPRRATV